MKKVLSLLQFLILCLWKNYLVGFYNSKYYSSIMNQEIKVQIYNVQEIERRLLQDGAQIIDQTYFIDTYFRQPKGKVLKIVEKKRGAFINIFQAVDGKFEVIKDEPIDNIEKLKKELIIQYGIKRIMKGSRKFFQFKNYQIIFNLIDNVGNFIIVTGESPSKEFVEKELGIEKPEYITVSFDEVRSR